MIGTLSGPSSPGTDGYVEWSQFPQLPLGFPRGEAGFFDKRHFGTDWQKSLMRGGDRLVHECGWMNGVCFSFLPFNRDFLNFLALATPHQPALTVPKCRQVRQLPPGGSQGEVAAADSMQRTQLFQKLRVAKLATPTLAGQNDGCIPFPYDTPSASPLQGVNYGAASSRRN